MNYYRTLLLFLFAFAFGSCSKNNDATTPLNVISSNVNHKNFVKGADSLYLMLSQNKIRFLDARDAKTLNISSTLPLTTIAFEKVEGTQKKLFIQTENAILLYELTTDNAAAWAERAKIDKVTPCDLFASVGNQLAIAQGEGNCSGTKRTSNYLTLYNVSDFSKPVVSDSLRVGKALELVAADSYYFLLDEAGEVSIFEQSGGKLTKRSQFASASATAMEVAYAAKKMFVRSPKSVQQYDISDVSNPKLVSTLTAQ